MIERITKGHVGDGSSRPFRCVRIVADGTDVTEMAQSFDTERRVVTGLVCDRKGRFIREDGSGPGTLGWLGYFKEVKLVDRARIREGRPRVYRVDP